MKYILLLLVMIAETALTAQAQNWACFYTNDTAYYLDDLNQMYGFAIVYSTVDAGVVKYKVFRTTSYDGSCKGTAAYGININKPTWAGPEIHKLGNGDYLFFNQQGDTITIKTMAQYRVPWVCHISSSNDTLFAQVYYEDTLTVNGALDSVKTILFSANTPFNNFTNVSSLELKLTKQHGLLTIPKMYTFPNENQYHGLAKTNLKPLTWGEVYNYSIGDYYQVLQTRASYLGVDSIVTYKELLDKNTFNNGNSVSYTFHREKIGFYNSGFSSYAIDTVLETYDNLADYIGGALPGATYFTGVSWEPISVSNTGLGTGQPFSDLLVRRTTRLFPFYDFQMLNDTCWNSSTAVDGYEPPYYFECLGPLYLQASGFDDIKNERVIYYNLCGVQHGSKLLLGIPELPEAQVKIYPNPAINLFEIENTSNTGYSISIANLQGQLVQTLTASAANITTVDVSNWALGVYIIKLDDGLNAYYKKLVVAR